MLFKKNMKKKKRREKKKKKKSKSINPLAVSTLSDAKKMREY